MSGHLDLGPRKRDLKPFATRVAAQPHTDAFMMGDRFGEVTRVGTKLVTVRMERSGRLRKFRMVEDFVPGLRVVS